MLLRLCRSFTATVTKDKLKLSFSRSQGSGVQSVNKINSKADGRFHIDSADWITPEAKSHLKQIFAHHINKQGELVVQSQSNS